MNRSPIRVQLVKGWLFILLVASAASLLGCAKHPKLQWIQAERALNETSRQLRAAHAAGQVSDDEILLVDPSMQAARAALADGKLRIAEGGPAFKADMRMLAAILFRITQTYGNTVLPPATQPIRP